MRLLISSGLITLGLSGIAAGQVNVGVGAGTGVSIGGGSGSSAAAGAGLGATVGAATTLNGGASAAAGTAAALQQRVNLGIGTSGNTSVGPNFNSARLGLDAAAGTATPGRGVGVTGSAGALFQARRNDAAQTPPQPTMIQTQAMQPITIHNRAALNADLSLGNRIAEIDRLRDVAVANGDTQMLLRADQLEHEARIYHYHQVRQALAVDAAAQNAAAVQAGAEQNAYTAAGVPANQPSPQFESSDHARVTTDFQSGPQPLPENYETRPIQARFEEQGRFTTGATNPTSALQSNLSMQATSEQVDPSVAARTTAEAEANWRRMQGVIQSNGNVQTQYSAESPSSRYPSAASSISSQTNSEIQFGQNGPPAVTPNEPNPSQSAPTDPSAILNAGGAVEAARQPGRIDLQGEATSSVRGTTELRPARYLQGNDPATNNAAAEAEVTRRRFQGELRSGTSNQAQPPQVNPNAPGNPSIAAETEAELQANHGRVSGKSRGSAAIASPDPATRSPNTEQNASGAPGRAAAETNVKAKSLETKPVLR